MSHIHIIHWLLDFLGVNNTYDAFSTKMYNFWSGFGANFSILALSGTIVGVYRHNLTRLNKLNAVNPINIVRKIEKDLENRENKQPPPDSSNQAE